ncbi:hypothetical protein [Thomasclavelia sp.]
MEKENALNKDLNFLNKNIKYLKKIHKKTDGAIIAIGTILLYPILNWFCDAINKGYASYYNLKYVSYINTDDFVLKIALLIVITACIRIISDIFYNEFVNRKSIIEFICIFIEINLTILYVFLILYTLISKSISINFFIVIISIVYFVSMLLSVFEGMKKKIFFSLLQLGLTTYLIGLNYTIFFLLLFVVLFCVMSLDHFYYYFKLNLNKENTKLICIFKKFNYKIKKSYLVKIINEKQILLLGLALSIILVFFQVMYLNNQLFKTGLKYASQNTKFTLAQNINDKDDKYIVFDQKDQRMYIKINKVNEKNKIIKVNIKEFYYLEESKYKYSIIKNYHVER